MKRVRVPLSYPAPDGFDGVSQAHCRGGSFAVESAAAFAWNGWQASSGISGNLGLEYADYAARTRKRGVIVNDAGREIGIKMNAREKLAHVLQGAESMALQSMLTALSGRAALMQHDGLTVHGDPDLADLDKRITADTSYVLTLESERL